MTDKQRRLSKKEWIYEAVDRSIWKPIKDGYSIASCGCILSETKQRFMANGVLARTAPIIKKPAKTKKGYLFVNINKGVSNLCHRLTAIAWIPNPDNLKEVNHIDGDKTNNHISNLEWVTSSQNKIHAYSMGLYPRGGDHPFAKIILNSSTGIFYECVNDAANSIPMRYSRLRDRLIGKVKNDTHLQYV